MNDSKEDMNDFTSSVCAAVFFLCMLVPAVYLFVSFFQATAGITRLFISCCFLSIIFGCVYMGYYGICKAIRYKSERNVSCDELTPISK